MSTSDVTLRRFGLARARTRLRSMRHNGERIQWGGYLFVLPFFAIFTIFTLAAIIFGIYLSANEWNIIGSPQWVGLENFKTALDDKWAWKVWGNTARYTLMVVPIQTVLGLIFAMFVNQRWRGYVAARLAFYAPRVVAVTVVGLVWVWLLDTRFGLINIALAKVGISQIPWLTNPRWVLWGVAITSVWWAAGYNMVILLAALQDVPQELREAALIDGANELKAFWYVVLPHLRPALSLVVTLGIIAAFRVFGQVYVMTQGGPAGASSTIIFYIYDRGFTEYQFGYAAALSILLFFTILIVTIVQQRFVRETAS